MRHQGQIDHGSFVDYHTIQDQGVVAIVSKSVLLAPTQQAMDSARFFGNAIQNGLRGIYPALPATNGPGKAGCGLAGWGCQRYVHRWILFQQQSKNLDHGSGFTGTRPARDDRESPAGGYGCRHFLPVDFGIGCIICICKQPLQALGQQRNIEARGFFQPAQQHPVRFGHQSRLPRRPGSVRHRPRPS